MDIKKKIIEFEKQTIIDINILNNIQDWSLSKAKILGKKSFYAEQFNYLKNNNLFSKENTEIINNSKRKISNLLDLKKIEILNKKYESEIILDKVDPYYNYLINNKGNLHPINKIVHDIKSFFQNYGFYIIEGNEIETIDYNFEKLNIDENHPARQDHDSFYFNNEFLLRTHCTNMTSRYMSDNNNIDAILSIGNVYRRDADDATHSHQFMQMDGFMVGDKINFSNLIWLLKKFCKFIFGEKSYIRLRPSYFPFTEPSVEIDVSCFRCNKEINKNCKICKNTGYIEILGAGLINPKVFDKCNYSKYSQGFAFGVGIERICMLKYNFEDIRDLYNNDLKILNKYNYK